ncbi:MAG: 16S rRNA (cytosine(1402)-N(4))-methyltransferase RsmH [Ruminococcaceae bacterium]|nr:16S rRNA (cytosine(1402)-N(4))-methyltransferase RsmH [Oscillospiraceae bacterium]
MEFKHVSVLLNESVDGLCIKPDGIYADGTLGGGGHSFEIASRLSPNGKLIGIDRDLEALAAAKKRLEPFSNVTYVHSNFSDIKNILSVKHIPAIDGAVIDLGVSSYQLDCAERGFSYMEDAPLDMRMDKEADFSAYDVVNSYSEQELTRIFFEYGEERFSKRVASLIVEARKAAPVSTTLELVEIIKKAIPEKLRQKGSHPAKRVFQAIRIEVNSELEPLKDALTDFFDVLSPGGRLCVITFHSLEDRIVKQTFASFAKGCTCPKDFPICVCGNKPRGKVITTKPILPSDDEMEFNKRSKSAKLRICEKL